MIPVCEIKQKISCLELFLCSLAEEYSIIQKNGIRASFLYELGFKNERKVLQGIIKEFSILERELILYKKKLKIISEKLNDIL